MPSSPVPDARSPQRSALRTVVYALLASALAGVLVAGLALPLVGGAGLAARAGADSFQDLPDELATPPLPQRSTVYASDGTTQLATIFNQNRVVVPLDRVPQSARLALVAIEDSRFYEHRGVDYRGLARAAVRNRQEGEVTQGGSTLTQQYVKNVLLQGADSDEERKAAVEDEGAAGYSRKLREARYAIALEQTLSKDEILERYLNIIYFGSGVYGIGTAAQRYYSKPVEQLTTAESALLVGLLKNPGAYDPVRNPDNARARRDVVLRRMAEVGFLSPAEAEAAVASPIGLRAAEPPDVDSCQSSFAPYFCGWVLDQAKADPAFGATPAQRMTRLYEGGLTIKTSIDVAVQAAAQAAVDRIPHDHRVGSASVVVEPGTGLVKAMAVNRDYGDGPGQSKLNLATGGSSGFQAGSTFKVFTLAEAIRQGIPLSTTINSPATYVSPRRECQTGGRPWEVSNASDSENGYFDMFRGTHLSVNTYYAQLIERTGLEGPAKLAEEMGVTSRPLARVCSQVLGVNEVSPLDMATAYATFAAHGSHCAATGVLSYTEPDGKETVLPPAACRQVLDPAVADTVTSVLQGVLTNGTGTRAAIGRPAAGKTGTTQSFGAAWFVGYTPELATAVWMGDPRGNAPEYALRGVLGYARIYGGDVPAQIWRATMSGALAGAPERQFERAPATPGANRVSSALPSVIGQTQGAATRALRGAGYAVQITGRIASDRVAVGRVVRMSPSRNAAPGSVIRLTISAGRAAPSPPPAVPVPPAGPVPPAVPPVVPPPGPPAP